MWVLRLGINTHSGMSVTVELTPLLPHCVIPVTSFVALMSDLSAGYHTDLIPVSQRPHNNVTKKSRGTLTGITCVGFGIDGATGCGTLPEMGS